MKPSSTGRVRRIWCQRLRIDGKAVDLGLGSFPVTTLAEARAKALANRRSIEHVRPELDSAVLPSVRAQPGASVSVHLGLQPGELPAPVMSAQRGQALVAEERPGQADQDGRSAGAPLPAVDLSVVRGVGSSTVVSGSAGSYRPVIAGAKLREDATTILPRGRAL